MAQEQATVSGGELSVKGYRLLGPMGDRLVEAQHVNLNRKVALALLRGERGQPEVEAFLAAARTQARIHHPHVVAAVDAGTCPESGVHFLANELMDGGSLQALLDKRGQLADEEALALVQAVCEALVCLEELELTHGDVRPANILLTSEGIPKLANVARITPFGPDVPVDRARHAAPELFAGEPPSIRSDLYGLGLTLVRALTGGSLYDGSTYEELRRQHAEGLPTRVLRRLSPGLSKVIASLTARAPEQRYPSAHDANLDLVRVLSGAPPAGADAAGSRESGTRRVTLPAAPQQPSSSVIRARLSSRGVCLAEYEFDQDTVTIGRVPGNDIAIDNPIVSRRHAQITRQGSTLTLTALSSTNITAHNGVTIKGSVQLTPGDLIVISDKFHIEVAWRSAGATPRPAPASSVEEDDTPVVGTPVVRRIAEVEHTPPAPSPRPAPPAPKASDTADTPPAGGVLLDDPYGPAPEALDDPYGPPPPAPATQDAPYADATEPVVRRDPAPAAAATSLPPDAPTSEFSDTDLSRLLGPPQGYLTYGRHGRTVRSFVDKGFQVGSSPACDLRLGRGAPRKAAMLVRCVDAYRLYNVAPEVGVVKLNGEPVPDQAVLEDGDQIDVCGEELTFSVG